MSREFITLLEYNSLFNNTLLILSRISDKLNITNLGGNNYENYQKSCQLIIGTHYLTRQCTYDNIGI